MEFRKKRFFATLKLARIMKENGLTRHERQLRLGWFQHGYLYGFSES